MGVRKSLKVRGSVRERTHELFRRALAVNGLWEVGQDFNKKDRRYVGHIEVVHQGGLVDIEALQ